MERCWSGIGWRIDLQTSAQIVALVSILCIHQDSCEICYYLNYWDSTISAWFVYSFWQLDMFCCSERGYGGLGRWSTGIIQLLWLIWLEIVKCQASISTKAFYCRALIICFIGRLVVEFWRQYFLWLCLLSVLNIWMQICCILFDHFKQTDLWAYGFLYPECMSSNIDSMISLMIFQMLLSIFFIVATVVSSIAHCAKGNNSFRVLSVLLAAVLSFSTQKQEV